MPTVTVCMLVYIIVVVPACMAVGAMIHAGSGES